MKTVSATYVRNNIAQTWTMAQEEPVAVEIYGMRKAIILSPDEYGRLTGARKPRPQEAIRSLFDLTEPDSALQITLPGMEEFGYV